MWAAPVQIMPKSCGDALKCVLCFAGRVFTILRVEEVRHFKGLLRKVDNAFVKDHSLQKDLLESVKPECKHALQVLQHYLTQADPQSR